MADTLQSPYKSGLHDQQTIESRRDSPILDAMATPIFYFPGAFMLCFRPHGQGLAEYALLVLLVGLAVIVLLALFGEGVMNLYRNVIANF